MLRILFGFFAFVLFPMLALAATSVGNLPEVKELADPFKFNDGSPVKTPADWTKRRDEIKELLAEYEYGHLPPTPKQWTLDDEDESMFVDPATGAITQYLSATYHHDDRQMVLHFRVVTPKDARGVPVVIQPSFGPLRRAVSKDDKQPAWPDPAISIVKRGYAYVEFQTSDVAPDSRETARDGGVYKLFGKDIDCGALMAWAWGFHRAIDVVEDMGAIDAEKVIVTGHSRYGKAALVAGAFDDRIAVTAPSHSGCGGAAPYRFIYGKSEQLHNIVNNFPYWFQPKFSEFVDNVDRLPVDQHLLLAAVAPRALLSTEGTDDYWINPEGSQLTYMAAKEVYKFLAAENKISIHFREVGHIPNNGDVLDFADHVLFDKPLDEQFGKLPYPVAKNGHSWKAPAK